MTTTTEELNELRAVARSFLLRDVPPTDLRAEPTEGYPYDHGAWTSLAENLGLQGLLVAESSGGLGLGLEELAVVCEELGRALYGGPFLASAVVASALFGEVDEEPALLGELASGNAIGALVSALLPGRDVPLSFTAELIGDEATVSGEEAFVVGAREASVLLVPAITPSGLVILAVDADAEGVRVETLDSIDLLRPVARVTLTSSPGRVVVDASSSARALEAARLYGDIALAAESIGAAARALEMTVEYVAQRVQFGRVIGAFQAVKHRCAEMVVQLEGARSALFAAVHSESPTPEERQLLASMAKVSATDAFFFIANETVHLHGGIGFTWEHPAHLFYRRAKANQLLWGTQSQHRRAMFQALVPTYQYEGNTK